MATFEIEGPDGKTYEVEAPDMQTAAQAFQGFSGGEKKPMEWSDVPGEAYKNSGASVMRFVDNVTYPIRHPIDTATGLADIAKGLGSKAAGLVVDQDPQQKAEREAAADAVGAFFKERYGSVDAFKETLAQDPVGVLADVSIALSGGGTLAARLPGAVGKVANTVSQVGGALNPAGLATAPLGSAVSRAGRAVANVGRAVNPVVAAAAAGKGAAQATGKVASEALGVTTGTGSTPIEQAFRSGRQGNRAFLDHMRGNVPQEVAVDLAESAVDKMGRARSAAYKQNMSEIDMKRLGRLPNSRLSDAFKDAHKKVFFNGVPRSAEAADTLTKIADKVAEFQNLGGSWGTIEGLDALKQAIGEVRQSTKQGTLSRVIANDFYRASKVAIEERFPQYAKAMRDYSAASDQIGEARRTLSVNDRASTDTTLRKLQSTQRNNVNTSYGSRARLVDDLAQYEPDLPAALAGQTMSQLAPRGIARVFAGGGGIYGAANMNPMALAVLPATSPRVVGEVAYGAGRAAQAGSDVVNALTRLAPGDAYLNALMGAYGVGSVSEPLRGGIGPRYDENGNLIR